VATVRVFSAYGPWEEPTRLVPYVMACCSRGEDPQVTSGRQPRDFIYVEDVVDLLKTAAASPRAHGQILHAGTGVQHTVRDMIETIVDVCGGGRVRPQYGAEALRPGEPACWVAGIAHTTARVGWRPRHDLSGGIRQMWAWHRAEASRAAA
jgi:nucleoside-diphosphate-sugar epimerase